ncbi:hypothetical protein HYH03_011084 [Edaphochlamys debaryana]|uniref:Uncharacterized protein n=1 Tax=Edaphochlamys debaryana TaxID=47281 RepID=A0A835XWS3_9CHLO|nr:hypothetical protein HYH03_011084 [Edaphochlamys debaryana]|eukprot:KAG2490448.1 hypothetical protein HYH03_011084 [Edaphochlamys debaryana]
MTVIAACVIAGYDRVLILEDDLVPTQALNDERLAEAAAFMCTDNEWGALSLGYTLFDGYDHQVRDIVDFMGSEEVAPGIVRFYGRFTHCYALSRRGMERVLQRGQELLAQHAYGPLTIPYNEFTVQLFRYEHGGFSVVPMLFDQDWCASPSTTGFVYGTSSELMFRKHQCLLQRTSFFYWCSTLRSHRYLWLLLFLPLLAAVVALAVFAAACLVPLICPVVKLLPTLGWSWKQGLAYYVTAGAVLGGVSVAMRLVNVKDQAPHVTPSRALGLFVVRSLPFSFMLFVSLYIFTFHRRYDVYYLLIMHIIILHWTPFKRECILVWLDELLQDPDYIMGSDYKRTAFIADVCGHKAALFLGDGIVNTLAMVCIGVVLFRTVRAPGLIVADALLLLFFFHSNSLTAHSNSLTASKAG